MRWPRRGDTRRVEAKPDEAPAPVSASVIARDEEQRLPDCLRSLAFCDEIVVVDSGSRDRTVEIARRAGATVIEHPWMGFAAQRNLAADRATHSWVLEVDADERVTPELAGEIRAFLAGPPPADVAIAGMPIRQRFLGRALGPAADHPNYRMRLFRRDAYRHDERRTVHEGLEPRGRAWAFQGELEHVLATGWREALADVRGYARLEAEQVPHPGRGTALARGILVRPAAKAAYRLLARGAWRDGVAGVAKVLLDSASDALVWLHVARRGGGEPAHGGGGHFGHGLRHHGPPRLVALAAGPAAAAEAAAWLARARAAGGDVALVTDDAPRVDPRELHVRSVARMSPLGTLRAVEAESRLRALDALVPFGRRASLLARVVPRPVRGPAGIVAPGEPGSVVAAAERARA